jgi:hypothetical protein
LIGAKETRDRQRPSQRIDLASAVPAGVHTADDGSHAGTHHEIGSNAEAVEHPQQSDVSEPFGAPTREHQGGFPLRTCLAGGHRYDEEPEEQWDETAHETPK